MNVWQAIQTMPVLVISMPTRPDRRDRMRHHLQAQGIRHARMFDAVDGRALYRQQCLQEDGCPRLLSEAARRNIERKQRRDHSELVTPGALGCALSHIGVWQTVAHSNAPALVVEDDARTNAHGRTLMHTFPMPAADTYDVLLLGHLLRRKWQVPAADSSRAPQISPYHGEWMLLHAYIITPEGAQRALKCALPVRKHIDGYLSDETVAGRLRVLACHPACWWQSCSSSSIQSADTLCRSCGPLAWPTPLHRWMWQKHACWVVVGVVVVVLLTGITLALWMPRRRHH